MMRYVEMPDGAMLKIPHGWTIWTYGGARYRLGTDDRVYVWRADCWHLCPSAWIRKAA